MSDPSYKTEFMISVKPESVYKALTKDIDKWWTELSNQALRVGDQLTVRFEKTTSWMITVSEALPNQSLAWKVFKANHDLETIVKKMSGRELRSNGKLLKARREVTLH